MQSCFPWSFCISSFSVLSGLPTASTVFHQSPTKWGEHANKYKYKIENANKYTYKYKTEIQQNETLASSGDVDVVFKCCNFLVDLASNWVGLGQLDIK